MVIRHPHLCNFHLTGIPKEILSSHVAKWLQVVGKCKRNNDRLK